MVNKQTNKPIDKENNRSTKMNRYKGQLKHTYLFNDSLFIHSFHRFSPFVFSELDLCSRCGGCDGLASHPSVIQSAIKSISQSVIPLSLHPSSQSVSPPVDQSIKTVDEAMKS